jgi:hypothetical protein
VCPYFNRNSTARRMGNYIIQRQMQLGWHEWIEKWVIKKIEWMLYTDRLGHSQPK